VRGITARRPSERGFTFVEVTLVVLIIGLLIAISVPSFLGAKQRANDRSAQVSLRHTLTNAKSLYSDDDSFANATPTSLHAIESALTFATGVSTGPKVVSVDASATRFTAAAKSRSGLCYVIGDGANEAGTVFAILAQGVDCDAVNAPVIPNAVPAATSALIGGGWAKGW
jgi:type IV pilus assembly protein PilA